MSSSLTHSGAGTGVPSWNIGLTWSNQYQSYYQFLMERAQTAVD